jgi:F-type H+-transporting ATPase subunit delta
MSEATAHVTVAHPTVLDTGAEQLGKIYAQALVDSAAAAGVADEVLDQLGRFVDEYLAGSPQLATALASPRIDQEDKARVIDRLLADEFHPLLIKFLKVMGRRGRLGYVAAVRTAADSLRDQMLGRTIAEVRTAVPLEAPLRQIILERITAATAKQVRLVELVDPQLVGGMVIRIGDTVFDGSVANQINKLAKNVRSGFSRELLQRFESFAGNEV